jgi:hypothetical protein
MGAYDLGGGVAGDGEGEVLPGVLLVPVGLGPFLADTAIVLLEPGEGCMLGTGAILLVRQHNEYLNSSGGL